MTGEASQGLCLMGGLAAPGIAGYKLGVVLACLKELRRDGNGFVSQCFHLSLC